ncbi:(2Fe-2S)-binding protein [Candidatus Riflebacteria bacterium]
MKNISFTLNGEKKTLRVDPDMPLLWVLRDILGLTGTKFACGQGACGACMVHINGKPRTSCTTRISSVAGKEITTIEGLAAGSGEVLFKAWEEVEVSQCGFCQPGQVMTAAALLKKKPEPTDADIDKYMSKNICRCGTYQRIKKAIKKAAKG